MKKQKWLFQFEDTDEVVALGNGTPEGIPWGPWDTEEDALDALMAEMGASRPDQVCYELVQVWVN